MNALREFFSLLMIVSLGSACTKKDDAIEVTMKPDQKVEITVGKTLKGVMLCGAPMVFTVVPPADATAKLEVRIPKGASQTCFRLTGRDAAFATVESKTKSKRVVVCSQNPETFSSMDAPFGKDVTQFTIEPNATQPCVLADFRLSLSK